MSLSTTLKQLLFENEIKPSDLAKAINLPVSTITRIIAGKTKNPTQQSINEIAQYFNCTSEYLLNTSENHISNRVIKHIPCWEWSELDDVLNGNIKIYDKVIVTNVSDKAFALKMPDHSMAPVIEKDSLLIFDNIQQAIDRNYVLVSLGAPNKYVVRQLLIDAEYSYIQSINNSIGDKSVRLLTNEDKIIGRLVEIRRKTI